MLDEAREASAATSERNLARALPHSSGKEKREAPSGTSRSWLTGWSGRRAAVAATYFVATTFEILPSNGWSAITNATASPVV